MKNLIVSKTNTNVASLRTAADIVDRAYLADGEVGIVRSDGAVITAIANTKADYRGQTFNLVQGKPVGSSPKVGISLNPFNFKFRVKKGVTADSKVVTLNYNLEAGLTMGNLIGSSIGVRIVLMNFPKTVYSNTNFEFVETQVKASDTLELIQARLKTKLDALAVKIGNGFTVTNTNGATYYGFSFTADAGFNFTVVGSGLAETAPVATIDPVIFGEGSGAGMLAMEKTFATHLGYNPNVKLNEQVYTEGWDIDPTITYDVIIIESVSEAQYELLQNDNKGMLVTQWVAVPTGGTATTGTVDVLIAILTAIQQENQGITGSAVDAKL